MQHYVLILCGGSGTRVGGDVPKQFIPLCGHAVVWHTVEAFRRAGGFAGAVVVVPAAFVEETRALFADHAFVRGVTAGGATREASSREGFRCLYASLGAQEVSLKEISVHIHDGARPFVHPDVLRRLREALEGGAPVAVTAVASTDTVYDVEPTTRRLVRPLQRERLYRAQTPQSVRADVLQTLFSDAWDEHLAQATDDVSAVLTRFPEMEVRIVPGTEENFKITFPSDLERARNYLHALAPTTQEE